MRKNTKPLGASQSPVDEAEKEPIYQISYVSAEKEQMSETALDRLLYLSRSRNKSIGVTGMLLYHEGSFLQVLEGNEPDVLEVWGRISKDERHHRKVVVFSGPVEERVFEDWSMGYERIEKGCKRLPRGFSHFLERGFVDLSRDPDDKARMVLNAFREGRWHQADIELEEEAPQVELF